MEQGPQSNAEVRQLDLFEVVNNYFLLFFASSCVIASLYIQQMFLMVGYYRAGISVATLVGIILPVYLLTRRFRGGILTQLDISPPRGATSVFVLLATVCSVVMVAQIYMISQHFLPVPDHYMETLEDLRPDGGWSFAIVFLGMCVLVPIAEEFVFRGFFQRIFERNMGGVTGFVLAGLIFGAAHLSAHMLISISFYGVFLGFVYYATRNLTYTILSHSLFNTIALLQQTFTPDDAGLPFYLSDIRVFIVALVLLVYFLYKIKQGGPHSEPPRTGNDDQGREPTLPKY